MPAGLLPTLLHRDHAGAVYGLAIGGGEVLTGGGDGLVLCWSPSAPGITTAVARLPHPVYCLALARDGGALFIGTANGDLHAIDLAGKRLLSSVAAHPKGVYAIAELPGGGLATAGGDGSLCLWQRGGPGLEGPLRRIPLADAKARALALAPQARLLAAATGDGALHLVDAGTLNAVATWPAHEGGTTSAAFHPAKPVLMSGGKDGHLRAWRLDPPGQQALAVAAHRGSIYAIACGEGRIATASRDKTIGLWDSASLTLLQRLGPAEGGHRHSVNAAAFDGDGLVTAGDDRRVLRWPRAQNG